VNRSGFTLIELLVVLTVVGVLLGLSLLRADFEKAALDTAIQEIGLALGAAQRNATLRQHDVVVLIDAQARSFTIHSDENNDGVLGDGEAVRRVQLGDGVEFGRSGADAAPIGQATITFTKIVQGKPAIIFHRNGSSSEYGGFYLTHTSGGTEYARAIEITRSTGQVRCYSYDAGQWEAAC
jgi:prepilin-type N-terminal cleavage/methylation domain-containing protein